jgi:hypothetical protein
MQLEPTFLTFFPKLGLATGLVETSGKPRARFPVQCPIACLRERIQRRSNHEHGQLNCVHPIHSADCVSLGSALEHYFVIATKTAIVFLRWANANGNLFSDTVNCAMQNARSNWIFHFSEDEITTRMRYWLIIPAWWRNTRMFLIQRFEYLRVYGVEHSRHGYSV